MSDTGGLSLADRVAKYKASGDTFAFTIHGDEYKCARLSTAVDLMALERYAAGMVEVSHNNPNPQWLAWKPWTDQVVRLAAFVSRVMLEPRFSMAEALMFAHECGPEFMQMGGTIMLELGLVSSETEEAAIDEEGEPSSAEDGGGNSPSSPETSTTEA